MSSKFFNTISQASGAPICIVRLVKTKIAKSMRKPKFFEVQVLLIPRGTTFPTGLEFIHVRLIFNPVFAISVFVLVIVMAERVPRLETLLSQEVSSIMAIRSCSSGPDTQSSSFL